MPHCRLVKTGTGVAVVRMSDPRMPACSFCKKPGAGIKQCDYRLNETKTCDAHFCLECGRHEDPDTDYCPIHKGATKSESRDDSLV